MTKSNEFEEAYTVELPLNLTPNSIWKQIFEQEYKVSLYLMKRKVTVMGGSLIVVTSPHDDLKAEINWVKGLINSTNQRYEEHQKQAQEEEKRRNVKEEDKKRIRNQLRQ